MRKRTLKVALLAALATILVLSFSSIALADQTWSDLPDTVTAKYGITDNQVAGISDGFPDGTWKPFQAVTRAQFTKMAVLAFDIPLANPATPSFTDVPKGSLYYEYIEGAKAAAITNGTTPTTFGPNQMVTRAQAVAIVARYVAMANGYDLATMYTSQQVADLLSHFGDAASISSALQVEVAFAFDMGITTGDAYGNFNPQGNMLRIQGAAFLIRAQGLVPPENWTAADIELVSADKSENLIGKTHSVTFKVTTADGHPAKGVLVDFDTAFAQPLYVGNVSPQAAMTDSEGMVTVNLNSAEPGTQRLYATIVTPDGLMTEMTTKYWVVLDEVYLTDPTGEMAADEIYDAENNAGDDHTFCFRVVVFGPGPLSTSQYDWYNVYDPAADPADIDVDDGQDWGGLNYADELDMLALDLLPRTMAGIGLEWLLESDDFADPEDLIVSADTVTDADGLGCITLNSTVTGTVDVNVVADYPENPYPKQLFLHDTFGGDWDHYLDWEDQPEDAWATKTWIPHVIGGDDEGPVTPTYAVNNTGEVEEFVLELKDVYGNPIPGYTVEWWIQGVGEFKTDDSSWSGIGEQNKDVDVTDEDGMANAWVKSLIPGQTILHVKVMDKFGLPYKEWNVVKQWYSIDQVIMGQIVDGAFVHDTEETNEVNSGHTWTAFVGGAKYVHVLYDVNLNGLSDDQALIGDRDDLRDAAGYVAAMVNNQLTWVPKLASQDVLPGQVFSESNNFVGPYYTRPVEVMLEGAEFWHDVIGADGKDDIAEVWSGLGGKTVYFFTNIGVCPEDPTSNTPIATVVGDGAPQFVGSITSDTTAVTDDMGFADVSINSTNKGYQYTYAVADYMENPQDGDPLTPLDWAELRWDCAAKLWLAAGPDEVTIFAQGEGVIGDRWVNPVLDYVVGEEDNPNVETIAVQVFDEFGNALEGYKVTWEVLGQGTTTAGAMDTYHPYAHLATPMHDDPLSDALAGVGDRNPFVNSNMLWGDFNDGVHPQSVPDAADDDYAWGWTLNHQINFTLDLDSAAHVDLVLDETLGQLQAGGLSGAEGTEHFTNIVNIKVYTPAGALMGQWEVTKVWTLEPQSLDSIVLEQSIDGTVDNPYDTDMITDLDGVVYYRATLLDQFGNPIAALDPVYGKLYLDCDVLGQDQIVDLAGVASDGDGYIFYTTGALAGGVYTATYWVDTDGDNQIDASELASNSVVANVVINPAPVVIN